MTSVWADFKAEEKGDVKFALRPDLLKEEPEEGYVEPLMSESLIPNHVRDALVSEMAALAHSTETNRDAYKLLKKIMHLGTAYKAPFQNGQDSSTKDAKVVETPSEDLVSVDRLTEKAVGSFIESMPNPQAFFSEAVSVYKKLPVMGLTTSKVPSMFSHLGYAGLADIAAKTFLTTKPVPDDKKLASAVANLSLESALVRGSLNTALATAAHLAQTTDLSIFTSTLEKLVQFQVPERVVSKQEKAFDKSLKAKVSTRSFTGPFVASEEANSLIRAADSEKSEKTEKSEKSESDSPTLLPVPEEVDGLVASAVVLSRLEQNAASYGPSPAELLYLTGQLVRDVRAGAQKYLTSSSFPSSPGQKRGISFELHVKSKALTVTGLESMMSASGVRHRVYHRVGNCEQSQLQSSAGWTLLLDDNNHQLVTGSRPELFLSAQNLTIECLPNTIHSFYFHRADSNGMGFASSQSSYTDCGPSNEHFSIKCGRSTGGSDPFGADSDPFGAGNFYAFMGCINYRVGPYAPSPSPAAPLQLDLTPTTFESIIAALEASCPGYLSGANLDDRQYTAVLHIVRASCRLLQINIYQFSLLESGFVLSADLLARLRAVGELLQQTPEPRQGFDLSGHTALVQYTAQQIFLSALSLFYPTPLAKFEYAVTTLVSQREGNEQKSGEANTSSHAATNASRLVANSFISLLGAMEDEKAFHSLKSQVQRVLEAYSQHPSIALGSTIHSIANSLSHAVWFHIDTQQEAETKKEVPTPDFCVIVPPLLWQFFVDVQVQFLQVLSSSIDVDADLESSLFAGSCEQVLASLYLVSSPQRQDLSLRVLPFLLSCTKKVQQYFDVHPELLAEAKEKEEDKKAEVKGFQYYKLEITGIRNSSANMMQLTSLNMYAASTSLSGATATNPNGRNPSNEGPENAMNPSTGNKWLDFNFTSNNRSTLLITFPTVVAPTSYELITGNDEPNRDPTSWTLSGANDAKGTYVVLDSKSSVIPPSGRRTTYGRNTIALPSDEKKSGPPQCRCNRDSKISTYRGGDYKNGWSCNNHSSRGCGGNSATMGDSRWFCNSCNSDICYVCEPYPAKNDDGVVIYPGRHASSYHLFYCGRSGCGPTQGAQCASCERYSAEPFQVSASGYSAIGVRSGPAYPGDRTGADFPRDAKAMAVERKSAQYNHNGTTYTINFYRLQDGRGWLHDFHPNNAGVPNMTVPVLNLVNLEDVGFAVMPFTLDTVVNSQHCTFAGNTVTKSGGPDVVIALANQPVSGKVAWGVRIHNFGDEMWVGVCRNREDATSVTNGSSPRYNSNLWTYKDHTRSMRGRFMAGSSFGEPNLADSSQGYNNGDLLGFYVDTDAKEMRVYRNNVFMSKCTNLPGTPMWPYIGLDANGDRIEFVNDSALMAAIAADVGVPVAGQQKNTSTPASTYDMLLQASAQTLFCLLRGPPPTADEKTMHKWTESALFSGGLANLRDMKTLAGHQTMLASLGLDENTGDVPVDSSPSEAPDVLVDHFLALEPRSFSRKNLKSVRALTIQLRKTAFAVVLKHNGQMETAYEVADALMMDAKQAQEDFADQLNVLQQKWTALNSLQSHVVSLHGSGEDAKGFCALAMERLTLLDELSAARSPTTDAEQTPMPGLERLNSLELMRQRSDDETSAELTARQRARSHWSKSRKVFTMLRNKLAPISRLKAVLKAREGVTAEQSLNPAVALIQNILDFIKLPVEVPVECFRQILQAQRTRALGRALALHSAVEFVQPLLTRNVRPATVALFLKHISTAFSRHSPALYPPPKFNGFCPTHPASGLHSSGQKVINAVYSGFTRLLDSLLGNNALFSSTQFPLYTLNLLGFEVVEKDLSWLSTTIAEFLVSMVRFTGTNDALMSGQTATDETVRTLFRSQVSRFGVSGLSPALRKAAWAAFRVFTYIAAGVPSSPFTVRLVNAIYLQMYQVSKQVSIAAEQEEKNPILLNVSAVDVLAGDDDTKNKKRDFPTDPNAVEKPVPSEYRTITLRHVKSGWFAAKKPGSHWHCVPVRTVLCAYTDGGPTGSVHHIRHLDGSEHMRHYSGDWDNFTQNSRDRDTQWTFIPSTGPDVFRLQNCTATSRYLSMTPLGAADNKLYVPDSSQNSDPTMWDWEIEWNAPQILKAPPPAKAKVVIPGRNQMGYAVAFGQTNATKLYCGRTGVLEKKKAPIIGDQKEHPLPGDHKTVTLRHVGSGWYAARKQGSHWHLVPQRTVLFVKPQGTNYHIRNAGSNEYMRHYSGDYDNFCQSYTDNDTRYNFQRQSNGNYWIQNCSATSRYLSMTPRGNTDNKLYVPDSSQMGDMAWREWEIEFDVPQILPAPVQDITKLLDTASSANVIAVDTTGSAKYGQSVSASEYKDLFGPQHGLFLRQNKPVSGKSVSNVIIQADGALSLTGHSVVTMVLPARAEEKCLPGLTFSVSFADQIAGETVLLSNKSDGVSFVLATSDFKSFALTLTDSNSAATSTVQFEAKCTWPEEKKDEKKSDEKKSDAKKTWNTVTVIQSATAEKHVGFKVYLGATCYADTLVDTACASFNAAVAGTRACAEAPFPESKIAFCEGFNGSASNLCVWRFALTEQQVSLFGNQALSDFIDEYKESEVAVAKENIKFAASGVLPKNVSFTLNVPEGEEQKTEIKLPEQKVDNSPLSEPEACQILFDHLRGSNELMDHKQFCDLVLLVDPPDVPDASDFAQMCTELGSPNGLNFTAFQNLFNEGPPVSATTVCTRLNLHRQSSQQQLLTQHGPSGHAVAKSTMSYVDTGVVVSSDLKITYTPNVESKTRQYTLSLVFTLDKYPEETGALVHIQNEVGQAALEVNSDGCLVVFGSVCDDKLSLSDVHTLIMAYSGDMGYGYVVLDSKVVAFFQSRHKKHLLQRYIVLFNGLEGSIARLILDSQVMALSKARAPADAASQEDFFDRVVATGFQPSWVKLALKEAEVERPTQATEWIMTRYVELCAAYAIEVANRSKLAVRSTLASMGFPMKWCAEALENATLSEAENEEITKGPAIATGLLLQKGLQYILANLQRLVATEPDIVIDPIITRDSSKINIDTGDEKKATASQSLSMIPDEGNDDDNAGAGDTSSKSFYAAVAASNGNVLGDVPLNVPPPLTKKSTAREKKSTAKAEEAFTKFQSSRLVSEKSLTLVYARTALLNVLAGDPQKLFQQDFAWLLRAMEHSFPEGLDILRDLFVDAILREAPTLADVAAPTPAQGLLIDTKRAPVMAKLVQEALFQLLAAAKIENGQNNEASTIQGSCANPRLAIFLLDLFFYVTSDLANQKGTDTAAQLRHLRPHLFNPLLVGLVFEVIPCTSPNYRLQFLRIISSLLNLNKKEGPVNSVYFEPQRCQAIKALMIKVYKTKTGAPSSFLRSLVELNVSVADELEALEAAEKAEAEAAEKAEAEAKAAAEKAAEWECEACTLVNPKDCTKCDACETPKPAGSDEDDLDGAKPAIVETKEETDTKEIDTKEEPSTGAIVRSASINTEGPLEMFWPLCQYSGPGDKNGIFYFLGSNMGLDSKWNNPATSDIVTVESSASAPGFIVNDFLKRSAFSSQGDKMCVEGSEANPAWISVQLGAWVVKPYCYSLRSPHSSGHLRNWNLEARLDEGPWVVLSENNEQASLSTADGICTWPLFMADPVKSEAMYNSFRIVLTGPNAAGALKLRAAGFELYGQLARRPTIEEDLEVPVVAAVVTEADAKEEKESKVEAAPLPVVVRPRVRIGNVASPQWFIDLSDMLKIMSFFSNQDVKSVPDRYNDFINGAQLSRAGWAELAGLMNAWSLKNSNASPDPAQLTIDDASLRGFSQLQNCGLDEKALRGCMHALVLFNSQVNSNMDFFDLQLPPHRSVLVDGLRDCCDLVFSASKIGNWNQALQSTQQGENRVTINVNPMSAATFQETGKVDEKANQTFWGQAFSQLRTRPSTMFRIAFGGRAFKCDYAGMRSIDAGGPYRDVIERMSMDIMAPYCGLFIKSPNQIAQLGENRNCFVPNPAATSRLQLEQFEFLGKMMGLALRTRNLLNIRVTSVVWKALVGASITMSDIEAIDVLSTNALKGLHVEEKNMPVELYNTEMADIKFTVTGSDSKVHELCKGGRTKSLTYANRQEYAALSFNFRSTEFAVQTAAIRRGLGKVVPLASLGLFSWRELETMVCGRGFAADQVELLKTNTTYKSYSATDQHIVWLWDILENDFTDEQRAMYLTFVWGRSRMPNTSAEFDTPHKISSRSGGNQAFPMAHTCFNTIDLPVYTDRAIMSQRLATAISMCGVIDGD